MNGNSKSLFDEIYEKYSRSAMEVALSVLNDIQLAQDACQLAFSYIAQNIDKVSQNPEKSRNYVLKVTRHFAIDEYRKKINIQSHEVPIVDDEEDDGEGNRHSFQNMSFFSVESFEDMVLKKFDMLELWDVLGKLENKYFEFIDEYYFQELTIKEIAEKHGISEGYARKKVYRSVAKLRKLYLKKEKSRNV